MQRVSSMSSLTQPECITTVVALNTDVCSDFLLFESSTNCRAGFAVQVSRRAGLQVVHVLSRCMQSKAHLWRIGRRGAYSKDARHGDGETGDSPPAPPPSSSVGRKRVWRKRIGHKNEMSQVRFLVRAMPHHLFSSFFHDAARTRQEVPTTE